MSKEEQIKEKAYNYEYIARHLEESGDLRTSAAFYEEAAGLYRSFNRPRERRALKEAVRVWQKLALEIRLEDVVASEVCLRRAKKCYKMLGEEDEDETLDFNEIEKMSSTMSVV